MLSYIEFDGKNSLRDFGALILRSSVRNPPQKKILMAEIPYNNYPLQFDLTDVYGESFYEPRTIEYHFRLVSFAHDSIELHNRYSMMCNWLYRSATKKLVDSEYPNTYFNARCTAITGMEKSTNNSGDFTVSFIADPFRRTPDYADIPWDNFIFDNDCLNQNVIYFEPSEHTGGVEIRDIYCFSNFDICPMLRFEDTLNGRPMRIAVNQTANFTDIYMKDKRLFSNPEIKIKPGRNHIIARGGGKLIFELYEEMI